jgi:hypothetical protein
MKLVFYVRENTKKTHVADSLHQLVKESFPQLIGPFNLKYWDDDVEL